MSTHPIMPVAGVKYNLDQLFDSRPANDKQSKVTIENNNGWELFLERSGLRLSFHLHAVIGQGETPTKYFLTLGEWTWGREKLILTRLTAFRNPALSGAAFESTRWDEIWDVLKDEIERSLTGQ